MESLNKFSEYYKTISNTELLSILDNLEDYQQSAIDAAKAEFKNRQLSDIEIQEARKQLISTQLQREKERQKIIAVENKIITAGHTFIDTINPIQSGIPSPEKTIRFIVIVFGSIFLYQLIKDWKTSLAYVRGIPRFPFESILYIFPQILLLVATVAFWRRKTLGWILLMIFLTFSCVLAAGLLFQSFTLESNGFNLFPKPSPTIYIIQLIFLVGTMYILCKTSIRDVFSISNQKMYSAICISGVATLVLMYATS